VSDALVLSARALRLNRRTPDALVLAIALPVLLMVLFVELFGGAIDGAGGYVQYVVPGVLVLAAAFGAGTTALAVSSDLARGVVDRFRSLDVGAPALLAGQVGASLVRSAVSSVLVVGVALALGFRPHAGVGGWLAAAAVLGAFVLAMSWLSAVVGLLATSPEGASGFTFFVSFLPYPSSAFVAVATLPVWLRGFAEHQPVSVVADALRALLLGRPAGSAPFEALAWCAAIVAVCVPAAGVLLARRAR
jgi:ABC-2 type transport system permease protein